MAEFKLLKTGILVYLFLIFGYTNLHTISQHYSHLDFVDYDHINAALSPMVTTGLLRQVCLPLPLVCTQVTQLHRKLLSSTFNGGVIDLRKFIYLPATKWLHLIIGSKIYNIELCNKIFNSITGRRLTIILSENKVMTVVYATNAITVTYFNIPLTPSNMIELGLTPKLISSWIQNATLLYNRLRISVIETDSNKYWSNFALNCDRVSQYLNTKNKSNVTDVIEKLISSYDEAYALTNDNLFRTVFYNGYAYKAEIINQILTYYTQIRSHKMHIDLLVLQNKQITQLAKVFTRLSTTLTHDENIAEYFRDAPELITVYYKLLADKLDIDRLIGLLYLCKCIQNAVVKDLKQAQDLKNKIVSNLDTAIRSMPLDPELLRTAAIINRIPVQTIFDLVNRSNITVNYRGKTYNGNYHLIGLMNRLSKLNTVSGLQRGVQTSSIYANVCEYYSNKLFGTQRILITSGIVAATLILAASFYTGYKIYVSERSAILNHIIEVNTELSRFTELLKLIGPESIVTFFVVLVVSTWLLIVLNIRNKNRALKPDMEETRTDTQYRTLL